MIAALQTLFRALEDISSAARLALRSPNGALEGEKLLVARGGGDGLFWVDRLITQHQELRFELSKVNASDCAGSFSAVWLQRILAQISTHASP